MISTSDTYTDEYEFISEGLTEEDAISNYNDIVGLENYHICGDVEEIIKVIRIPGVIDIGIDDIISTLSITSTNYVTVAEGIGPNRIPDALTQAIEMLPGEIREISKMIVNIWTNTMFPVKASELVAMNKYIGQRLTGVTLTWGVALDSELNEDGKVKITLIAANK